MAGLKESDLRGDIDVAGLHSIIIAYSGDSEILSVYPGGWFPRTEYFVVAPEKAYLFGDYLDAMEQAHELSMKGIKSESSIISESDHLSIDAKFYSYGGDVVAIVKEENFTSFQSPSYNIGHQDEPSMPMSRAERSIYYSPKFLIERESWIVRKRTILGIEVPNNILGFEVQNNGADPDFIKAYERITGVPMNL